MRLLSKEDILKNKVDTIEQFYILRYLKDNLILIILICICLIEIKLK
mgnify:CR=1 FL=1